MNHILLLTIFLSIALQCSAISRLTLPKVAIMRHRSREIRDTASVEMVAAVLPGSPLVTGTLTQGVINGISLYSNVLLARFALSWFPQILQTFPFLRPVITVTEPYLAVFRKSIPPIGGFDISALPAIFVLDILSQTTAAIGAEFPPEDEADDDMNKMKTYSIS